MMNLKRIVVVIMVIIMSVGAFEVTSYAATASTLRVEDASKPSSIVQGKYFDCKGVIKSNYKLTSVTGSIVASNGSTLYTKTVNPSSSKAVYTYNLYGSTIDVSMKFNLLSVGTYTYKITAKDSSGKSLTLVNQNFKITAATSTLRIEGETKPSNITKGNAFDCKGTIKSNYTLTSVTGTILSATGTTLYSKTVNPASGSYNLYGSTVDAAMKFNLLSVGSYTYKISAKDSSGKSLTLVNQKFNVVSATNIKSSLTWPTISRNVTSYYGNRTLDGKLEFHQGIDISRGTKDPIYAAADGIIEKVHKTGDGVADWYGNFVLISHTIDGQKIYTLYAHLDSVSVSVGQRVSQGTKIGVMGNTGFYKGQPTSKGTHLHFEVRTTALLSGGATVMGCKNPMLYSYK